MQEGIIIKNISNLYKVEVKDKVYACEARGKFKKDGIIPVVGDRVSITLLNEEKGIVEEILERRNYIKRPKIANITQIIYVLSMNMPKPDLLLLDKQLAFAEFLGINPVICINKIDLEKAEKILEIENLYKKIGYKVIKTNAKIGENIKVVEEILKNLNCRCSLSIRTSRVFPRVFFWSFSTAYTNSAKCFAAVPDSLSASSVPSKANFIIWSAGSFP